MTESSDKWLAENKDNLTKCVPLNTMITSEQCDQTKRKYSELLKKGFIESKVRYKKIYFCSAICEGLCSDDSKKHIGENTEKANREEREQAQRLTSKF